MSERVPLLPVAGLVAFALSGALALALASGAAGQQQIDLDRWKSPGARVPDGVQDGDSAWGPSVPLAGASPEFRVAREKAALRALEIRTRFDELHLAYEERRLDQRARTFAWQQRSTELIFWLVVLIVLSGLALSFWHVYRKESAPTKLTIGGKGVEVSSRLVGVLVFVLSLVFFYLYVKTVYPISEVSPAVASGGVVAGPAPGR